MNNTVEGKEYSGGKRRILRELQDGKWHCFTTGLATVAGMMAKAGLLERNEMYIAKGRSKGSKGRAKGVRVFYRLANKG